MGQGCTIAIEFAKFTAHFLNLLNSIVIEPRLVSKCKKSEGRYCYWYCTSSCMIIEFNCVIEILSLCILLLKLRLKCHFSSSTIATEIEKLLCAYCYWSWDWIVTFPHPLLQPKLKSYCVQNATEVEIELPLFLTHNCNQNWKAIVYRTATATEIEDNNFHYHDCHRYWKLDWAFAETDMRLKFSFQKSLLPQRFLKSSFESESKQDFLCKDCGKRFNMNSRLETTHKTWIVATKIFEE